MSKELVSVIIPCYNSEKFVAEAIDSVLAQTHKNIEIIVVEDGSTDNSLAVLKRYETVDNITVLQHENGVNKGVSTTRKLGVTQAKGSFIAFLDADDIFKPEKLEKQLNLFQLYPEVVLVHSKATLLNTTDIVFKNEFNYAIKNTPYDFQKQPNWLTGNHICNSSVLVKTELIHKYDFSIKQAFQFEDWLLWSLLSNEGPFYFQDEALLEYRVHEDSATSALINNQIKSYYSKMEYLFNFFTLSTTQEMKTQILGELKTTMTDLMEVYNPAYSAEFASNIQLVKASQEQAVLFVKNQSLQSENQKMKEELKDLWKIKSSKWFKIYSIFKK